MIHINFFTKFRKYLIIWGSDPLLLILTKICVDKFMKKIAKSLRFT